MTNFANQLLLEQFQQSPQRWWVRIIVASSAGVRVRHVEATVNAPEQIAALIVALATKWEYGESLHIGQHDELHILIDPMPPTDAKPALLTEEEIIDRAEKKRTQ